MAQNDDDYRREKYKNGHRGHNQGPWMVADENKGIPTWQDSRVGRDESEYPYNKVTQTPSGHLVEIDDTDGVERLRVRHKSGTYVEMYEDGMMQVKTENDMMIASDGNVNMKMTGNFNIQVTNGNLNIKSDGPANIETGSLKIKSGAVKWDASGDFVLSAPKIHFNP